MTTESKIDIDREKGNFHFDTSYAFDAGVRVVGKRGRYISEVKEEEKWMLDFRLKALSHSRTNRCPRIGQPRIWTTLISASFAIICLKVKNRAELGMKFPMDVKNTFERLGIPEQERKFLAGVEAQFDSEAAYSRMKDELRKRA